MDYCNVPPRLWLVMGENLERAGGNSWACDNHGLTFSQIHKLINDKTGLLYKRSNMLCQHTTKQ